MSEAPSSLIAANLSAFAEIVRMMAEDDPCEVGQMIADGDPAAEVEFAAYVRRNRACMSYDPETANIAAYALAATLLSYAESLSGSVLQDDPCGERWLLLARATILQVAAQTADGGDAVH